MIEPPPWPHGTPERSWYGMGRYYAMFPPMFAFDAINGLTRRGDRVLDPFCGRGNALFTASVMERSSLGVDINPIAWLYSSVKLNPATKMDGVLTRLNAIGKASRERDRRSQSRFETMAWSPRVRAFLKSARRELDWQSSPTDRTLMAFITLHMQDKLNKGLSNSLWPTIACSPKYAVKWWSQHGLIRPPDVNPITLLTEKIRRRYRYGIPPLTESTALLGDSSKTLEERRSFSAKLLITSPPYIGVTDYWNDHWIRLWMLGEPLRKNWKRSAKFESADCYRTLLEQVFTKSKQHLRYDASVLVRTDQRRQTADICCEVLKQTWPCHTYYVRRSNAPFEGVSLHHGRGGSKAQELDFLLVKSETSAWACSAGFLKYDKSRFEH